MDWNVAMASMERGSRIERSSTRNSAIFATVFAVLLLGIAGRFADMVFFDNAAAPFRSVERLVHKFQYRVEPAIMVGGIVLERTRHMVAGATLGCATGAGIGVTLAGGAALITGGAAGLTIPTAVSIGCALGTTIGGAFGYPLDRYNWDLDLAD
jgi:hypothetical protein